MILFLFLTAIQVFLFEWKLGNYAMPQAWEGIRESGNQELGNQIQAPKPNT